MERGLPPEPQDPADGLSGPDPGEDLVYCAPQDLSVRRRRRGRGFTYHGPGGQVRDAAELGRIKALGVPPAWSDVWICAHPHGHLQAVGRDGKGRRQYVYHPRFRARQEETKYSQLAEFGASLGRIRRRVDLDLKSRGLPKPKVLAAVVRLLDVTHIRIGNPAYARENGSFGLTTLLDRHADISSRAVRFRFRGKSGRIWRITLQDRRLAGVVRACQDLPGEQLFQYLDDDGAPQSVSSADVNAYLRASAGSDVSAKAFRTWAGTVLAARELSSLPPPHSMAQARRDLQACARTVSAALGNTPAVCRKCYIHPRIIELFEAGSLCETLAQARRQARRNPQLDPMERTLLALLRQEEAAAAEARPGLSAA